MLGKDATVTDVMWDSAAFKAGLVEGTQIVAVNGNSYDADELKEAIRAGKYAKAPLELLVKEKDHFRNLMIDYHGGLRYPTLERVEGQPALLDDILAPRG